MERDMGTSTSVILDRLSTRGPPSYHRTSGETDWSVYDVFSLQQ